MKIEYLTGENILCLKRTFRILLFSCFLIASFFYISYCYAANDETYVEFSLSKKFVNPGEPVVITVTGKDKDGLSKIGAFYKGSWHFESVSGTIASRTWTVIENSPGTYSYCAKAIGFLLDRTEEQSQERCLDLTVLGSSCTNECSEVYFQVRCYDDKYYQRCGNYDTDLCLEWSNPIICGSIGSIWSCPSSGGISYYVPLWRCSNNSCSYSCVPGSPLQACDTNNKCFREGETKCYDRNYRLICDRNENDCLEWKTELQSCVGDTSCGYGDCDKSQKPSWYCFQGNCVYECVADSICAPLCANECSVSGLTRCSGGKLQTCGNYDADSCLEWGQDEVCAGDTSCGYGICSDVQKPSWYCSNGECKYSCQNSVSCGYVPPDDGSSTDYCNNEQHCPDNICNCDEDETTCPQDCREIDVSVSIFAKKESDLSQWQESLSLKSGEKAEILIIVLNNKSEDIDNVYLKLELPKEIGYKGIIKIADNQIEQDISQEINIGYVSSNSEKRITLDIEASKDIKSKTDKEILSDIRIEDFKSSDALKLTLEPSESKQSFFVWLVKTWYLWVLLWLGFIGVMYWMLRRSKE
ncbi:MAG: hypothetical protein PHI53_02050 [Candidatus Pacebacteria bacterium]|nr:hypothetical protein [Candidatus Paceibacterota bacterium]